MIHVIETLKSQEGEVPEVVLTLEPTSPLRTPQLIDRCVETLRTTGAEAVITVVQTSALVGRVVDGRFVYLIEHQPRRRQDRAPLYRESGTVYATQSRTLLRRRSVIGERPYAVIVTDEEAIDINTPQDFAMAEAVLARRQHVELGHG